jgi:hypothetical protein
VPIALASDTLSIAVMEIVDNAIILVIPGAMDAGLDDVLFWGSLSFALFVAGFFAYPVNRWLLQRGKGHAAVHETGIHGGPDPRVVGAIAAAAGLFGAIVLIRRPGYAFPSASYSRRKPSNRRRWPCSSRRMSITMSCVTGSRPSQNSMMRL